MNIIKTELNKHNCSQQRRNYLSMVP